MDSENPILTDQGVELVPPTLQQFKDHLYQTSPNFANARLTILTELLVELASHLAVPEVYYSGIARQAIEQMIKARVEESENRIVVALAQVQGVTLG